MISWQVNQACRQRARAWTPQETPVTNFWRYTLSTIYKLLRR